jgi:Dolichyl-phosphate-mannose-protein mannosyltransferase
MKSVASGAANLRAPIFSACLGIGVLIVRAITSGPAYFADAFRHLDAIANHTYIIQPPGYWLFNRIGGLFPNAEHGLLIMNWCFSALGCMVFYACARQLVRSPLAELGALLYATVFFAWFSGNVHSTYASQLLFPPLTFYLMLRYREDKRTVWVCAVAVSFAVGAGFRPSDGAFMGPLLLLFFLRLPRRQQVILVLLTIVVCAAWMIPSEIARRQAPKGYMDAHSYPDSPQAMLGRVATGAILMGKVNLYTVSNALRFFLPLAVALGPSAVYMFRTRNVIALWLWAWVIPGSLFFLLLFISDAPYLDCLLGGFILLCLTGMARSESRRVALAVLTCSILINVLFYVGFRPRPPRNNLYAIAEKDLGDYSLYGVKHQFFVPRLALKP